MLAASSLAGQAEPVPEVAQWPDDQGGEQAADLVTDERDLAVGGGPVACSAAAVMQERGGEHGQGDPVIPGVRAADLVLIEVGQSLPAWGVCLRRSTVGRRP